MKYYIYNKFSNNGIKPDICSKGNTIDASCLDYKAFFSELKKDDEAVLIGGDGTINYFINALDTDKLKNNVYFYGAGTGNDFLRDIGKKSGEEVLLNPYLVNLPTVFVNGMEKKFINGIGYGIDGYCCEVADAMKEKDPGCSINYSAIAIKGILFHFKSRHVSFSVDGKKYEEDNAWLASSMKGRFYGGGLMLAPDQNRGKKSLTVVTYRSHSRLNALMNFPLISKGEHVNKTNLVTVKTGNEITVSFDTPCALQIDGETVLNVSEYTVKSRKG